jgi:hypothetical protein
MSQCIRRAPRSHDASSGGYLPRMFDSGPASIARTGALANRDRCNPVCEQSKIGRPEPGSPMFFTFPRTPAGTPSIRPWSSWSRSASTAASSGSCGACSNACCRSGQPRALRRGVISPADPVRQHRRAEAAPTPIDRGWERGDQRARLAQKHQVETVPTDEECLKSTQSRRRTIPTSWPRRSSPEGSHGRLRFNRLTGPRMAKTRRLFRREEVIE